MKCFCGACKGRFFRDKVTGQFSWKPVYLRVEILSEIFIIKAGPCDNCKTVNVLIKGIEIDYTPLENEHVVYL